jgi:hydrogenase maturation protease
MPHPMRRVVLGLGNILNKDEGLGVRALELLGTQPALPMGFELLDGGVLGLNLLMIVEECSHLLILDSVDADKPPGTLVELRKEDIPLYSGVKLSQHQVTFQEVLGLAAMRGNLPEHLQLIGIQPHDISIGLDLSDEVSNALQDVVVRAILVMQHWN